MFPSTFLKLARAHVTNASTIMRNVLADSCTIHVNLTFSSQIYIFLLAVFIAGCSPIHVLSVVACSSSQCLWTMTTYLMITRRMWPQFVPPLFDSKIMVTACDTRATGMNQASLKMSSTLWLFNHSLTWNMWPRASWQAIAEATI